MSSADSFAQFIPKNEVEKVALEFKLEKLMEEMIKKLTKNDAWDRMRDLMVTHMEEVGWERLVEARMASIVGSSDIEKRPYIDMLKELGGDELEEKLKMETDESKLNEVDYLVEQLVKIDRFAMSEDMKTRLFQMFEITKDEDLNSAYNSAREELDLKPANAQF